MGNLASQIFANIYLNELDKFVKHSLKIKCYLRYADDFIILENSRDSFLEYTKIIENFLTKNLKLKIHKDKIVIRKLGRGIDFCGYVVMPYYTLPRTKTTRRISKRLQKTGISFQALQAYLGYFSHSRSYWLRQQLKNIFYLGGF